MAAFPKATGKRLTTGTTTIKSGTGTLYAITINKALTGTVTVTDGATTIAVITNSSGPIGSVVFGPGIQYGSNLVVALSATEDITVCYE